MNHSRHLFLAISALLAPLACGAAPDDPVNVADYTPPIRVACLGDSITHGVGAGPGWAWPDQLNRMLGEKWDVRNFGHSGASVAKGEKHNIWSQKEYRDALLFHPDVVVILLGTNDTKPDNWAAKNEFPKLYSQLVGSFQSLSSKPRVYCGYPPYVAKKGAFGINEAGVKEQIPMIQAVAKELGAGVVDVHGATEGKDEVFKDNVHPNQEGATLIAKAVYKALAGKDWQGEIPPPSKESEKSQPPIRVIENPGELTYRETFSLIASESQLAAEEMAKIRDHFEATEPVLDAKIAEMEGKIAEYDQLRMKYKHTKVESEKPLYGEYKGKVAQLKQELEKYKRDQVNKLIALLPLDKRGPFGAALLSKYIRDRLAPVAATMTVEQWKKIREFCREKGPVFGAINNSAERNIERNAFYKTVYETVLTPEQKRRVEP